MVEFCATIDYGHRIDTRVCLAQRFRNADGLGTRNAFIQWLDVDIDVSLSLPLAQSFGSIVFFPLYDGLRLADSDSNRDCECRKLAFCHPHRISL